MTYQNRSLPRSDPQSPEYEAWLAECARNVAAQRRQDAYARSGALQRLQAYAERNRIPYEDALARVHAVEARERAYSPEAARRYWEAVQAQIAADAEMRRYLGLYDASDPANAGRKHVSWAEARRREAEAAEEEKQRLALVRERDQAAAALAAGVPWETKSAPVARLGGLEVKMVGGVARFTGYASTFGPPADLTGDIVDAGAFKDTLAGAKGNGRRVLLPVFWQHDVQTPIGGVVDAREDLKGLYIEGILAADTPAGQQAYSLLSKGIMSGLSIGYKVVRSRHDRDGIRHLAACDLKEISVVTFPANPRAGVTGINAA